MIDLRSDTVTKPTEDMRRAMYQAEVGDDVYEEDPTILELEETAASLSGHEAALFVASGTMGNQLAIMSWTHPGDEVIVEAESHIFYYELGGASLLSGVQCRPIESRRGIITPADLMKKIRQEDLHQPGTRLICLENTHNRGGGSVYSLKELNDLGNIGKKNGIPLHLDGARIFNAAVANNCEVKDMTQKFDSVMFCLSKGLCAPVGSMLTGSQAFIDKARRYRKVLGGGMRQAGILAAAGIIAIKDMAGRLMEDHMHAQKLAEVLAELGYGIDPSTVQTNIVIFEVDVKEISAAKMVDCLLQYGVKASCFGEFAVRFVTHKDINGKDVEQVTDFLRKIAKG